MHAAIVAGGFGTRAVGMTADRIPKALLPVGGVPIIFRQMRVLRREGVTRLTVLGGHLGDRLAPATRNGSCRARTGVADRYRTDAARNCGLSSAIDPGAEETLIVYGDMLFDISIAPLRQFHHRHKRS